MPLLTGGTAFDSGLPGPDRFSPSAGASPARILAALQRISGCAASAAELARVLADEAGALLHASAAVVSAGSGGLVLQAASGILAPREGESLAGEGICAAALRTGLPASSPDLARDPAASPAERALGAGPALTAPLGDSALLLALRPAGAAPFHGEDRAVLALFAEMASATAARIQNESWRRTWDKVLAATGRAVFRVELGSGRIEWSGGVSAPEPTVEEWTRRIAVEERGRVVGALMAEHASRLEFQSGDGERFLLETVPGAEPGSVAALLTAMRPPVPVTELIRAVRHELNNPLAVVAGTVQLIESSGATESAPELARSVRQIRDASDRLRDLSTRIALVERKPEAAFVTDSGGLGVAG